MVDITITANLMDVVWDDLSPDVYDWLEDNKIIYSLEKYNEFDKMILTLTETDAIAFKLRWW